MDSCFPVSLAASNSPLSGGAAVGRTGCSAGMVRACPLSTWDLDAERGFRFWLLGLAGGRGSGKEMLAPATSAVRGWAASYSFWALWAV